MDAPVPLDTIPRWSDTRDTSPESQQKEASSNNDNLSSFSKFPCDEDLNKKIRLWKGELWKLEVDAIVNSTNESISETQGICGIIHEKAGPDLQSDIEKLDGCRTGEAKLTSGFLLPSRHIIFTVGPRYNPKYQTAAENALHSSYRSCMQVAKEHNLASIAFCTIHSEARGYPPENGSHIGIRTIRRFLEKYGSSIGDVILCLERMSDYDLYMRVLPLYFPRTKEEERRALDELPQDTGDENGETVIEERKIRIFSFPGSEEDEETDATFDTSQLRDVDSPPSVLSVMQGDHDEEKRRTLANKSDEELEKERAELLYTRYLRRAREEDLSDIAQRNIFYRSGVDQMGRPLFVLVGMHLPKTEDDLERVLAYIVRILSPAAAKDFVVVYFHTNMAQEQMPDLGWLRKLHDVFNYKFAKYMRVCYIVHHTFWLKLMSVILSPFISSQITDKFRYFSGLADLLEVIDLQQLNIPNAVFQYDTRENGSVWNKPKSTDKPEDAL
jgi:O-acetyl-ADP-ribose deacetylase (regulator of RNase III)